MESLFNCTAYGRLGRCCRYSFYTTNTLAIATCLSAIGAGIWVVSCKKLYSVLFEPTLYVSVGFILIVVGVFSVVIGIVGFYATSRELRCLMHSFAVACLILFIMMLIGGIMAFVFQQQILTALQNFYGQPNYDTITQAVDFMQDQFRCCGVDDDKDENYMIWRTSKWHMDYKDEPKRQVPLSCCVTRSNGSYVDADNCQMNDFNKANASTLYMEGCYQRFYENIMQVATIEGWFGIAASFTLLLPAFFSTFLARLIQK